MTALGQSLRDPHSLMIGAKTRGNRPRSDCCGVLSLWVGAWNVLSQREDDHLSLLSSECKYLNIDIAALSEVWRPDCGEIMVGRYTYDCSGHSDGYHAQGVAGAVSIKLTPKIIEATPVNEPIMRRRIHHSLVSFPWSLYML